MVEGQPVEGFEFKCPSGFSAVFRKMKLAEQVKAAKNKNKPQNNFARNLLTACWLSTSDAGPYDFDTESVPPWDDLLAGDRFYLLLKLSNTSGNETPSYRARCPHCSKRKPYDININPDDPDSHFVFRKLEPEVFDHIKERGNRFDGELLDGRRIVYKLPTGTTENKVSKVDEASQPVAFLRDVLLEVEGLEHIHPKAIMQLDVDEVEHVQDMIDERNCGVDTTVELDCVNCMEEFDIDVPLSVIFEPGRRTRSRQQKRRAEKRKKRSSQAGA